MSGGRQTDLLLALATGLAAFLAIVGPAVLSTDNILWLSSFPDMFTHYLGWEFYRRGPATWPPGLSPDYGLQFSSAIMFSDSVPLLALPLKLLSPLLPAVFQYTGWWVLACFALQAWFAIRLVGLFTRDSVVKLAVAALLLFAPPFVWRLAAHYSLFAQWVVLAALFLYFAPPAPWRGLTWVVLLAVAALIHTYFIAMCVPVWLASLFRRGRVSTLAVVLELAVGFATIVGALWLAGFFPLRPTLLSGGYGLYSLNVLSLINPNATFLEPWTFSILLPPLPQGLGEYEGFNYLGVGGLLLLTLGMVAAVLDRKKPVRAKLGPLVIVVIGLTLFAISPMVTIADTRITIPVPGIVYTLAGSVRASGRFFWPVFYLLILAAVWLVHRRFGAAVTGPLLLVVAAIQIVDTYPGWSALRPNLERQGGVLPSVLNDPRLDDVARHYSAVRSLPAGNEVDGWDQIASFALRNRLPTDAVYLARPDDPGLARYNAELADRIAGHLLDEHSIYVVDKKLAPQVAAAMTPEDEMFRVGDFDVFAPGWHSVGPATTLPTIHSP